MKPSEKLDALVGPTGSGKRITATELAKLLEPEGYRGGYQVINGWVKAGGPFDSARNTKARRAVERVLGLSLGHFEADGADALDAPEPLTRAQLAVQDYLSSPRGETAPPRVAELMMDPDGAAFPRGFAGRVPTWEDCDDVRRIWERALAAHNNTARPKP